MVNMNDEKIEKSDIALREEGVQAFWDQNAIFEKSVNGAGARADYKGEFIFNDGPPFATGTPHYGHLVASAMKDAIPRYKTMQGYRVARQWGWDCHGLPIENIVEKELGTNGKKDIQNMGVKAFNDKCREQIFTYVDIWNEFIPRFGRWADMKAPYKTMDKDFMESEWWAFKSLYDKGLIYQDYRTMHVCPRCETTLAQSEVAEGYKIIKDLAVTVEFPMKSDPATVFLAWTTTPWTLPGNVALAVGANIEYVYVQKNAETSGVNGGGIENNKTYILAKNRVEHVFKDVPYTIVKTVLGKDLASTEYVPPFSSYVDGEFRNKDKKFSAAWKVCVADFITDDSGTGLAHEAPAFGAEDMVLAQEVGLPLIHHLGMDGVIKPEVVELAGLSVKPAGDVQATDVAVIKYLAAKGLLFSKEKYEHSYPHCWRCDTPLINYATSSWFVAVQKMKPELLENAKGITWAPAHIKNGRWGQWLEGAKDWSISRQRFWANTMPVWKCDGCKAVRVFGSCAELEAASGAVVTDLHKDIVDEVAVPCGCGQTMRRVPDVLDTWFNSGSVPYATHHYLGAGDANFTADFIAEGQDQVSKWFYYQHVLATGLFNKPAFNSVLVNGIVLAEDGKKMSKRLKNYPDPKKVIDTYGADAVRLYILSSPVVNADNLNFSEAGVAELSRKVIGRLVNVYEFYAQYAGTVVHGKSADSKNMLDQWILARLAEVHAEITAGYDAYDLNAATRPLIDFVDDLSTWYLRRSRDRIKDAADNSVAAADALTTMRCVCKEFAKLAAPSMPFIADWLWGNVKDEGDVESVHLAGWSAIRDTGRTSQDSEKLLEQMKLVRQVVTQGLEARTKVGIKVRQPLVKFTVYSGQFTGLAADMKYELGQIIAEELNVKEVVFATVEDGGTGVQIELDTNITPELKREGEFRDLLRSVQELRKNTGLNPGDTVTLMLPGIHADTVEPFMGELKKVANVIEVMYADGVEMKLTKV
jgi:isoleucyl-tRNA synthetase